MKKVDVKNSQELYVENFRKQITDVENILLSLDHEYVVHGNSEKFPLTHSFSEGVYIREMSMKKDSVVIGAIHNISHTWFLMKGSLIIATEEGVAQYNAPVYFNSKAGHKRVLKALSDSIFVNVHPNPDNITNTDELEKILTSKSYKMYKKINNKIIK